MKVVIVGAGIVGACLAYRLVALGAEVAVLDAGLPAGLASGRSFGWINASFYQSEGHHRLRAAGIEAHHRLASEVPGYEIAWPGCLWWQAEGAEMERLARELSGWGYPVDMFDSRRIREAEPHLGALPREALFFPAEGAADAAGMAGALLKAAASQGAALMFGNPVARLALTGSQVAGVVAESGPIEADMTVLCAGCGADDLLAPLGVALGIQASRGTILRTKPVPERIAHILSASGGEIRQDASGRLLAPAALNHQSADEGGGNDRSESAVAAALNRIRAMFPGLRIEIEALVAGERPVPPDGLPMIGRVGGFEGLAAAIMHSGVTLAPIAAEALACDLVGGASPIDLAPYRPIR